MVCIYSGLIKTGVQLKTARLTRRGCVHEASCRGEDLATEGASDVGALDMRPAHISRAGRMNRPGDVVQGRAPHCRQGLLWGLVCSQEGLRGGASAVQAEDGPWGRRRPAKVWRTGIVVDVSVGQAEWLSIYMVCLSGYVGGPVSGLVLGVERAPSSLILAIWAWAALL